MSCDLDRLIEWYSAKIKGCPVDSEVQMAQCLRFWCYELAEALERCLKANQERGSGPTNTG